MLCTLGTRVSSCSATTFETEPLRFRGSSFLITLNLWFSVNFPFLSEGGMAFRCSGRVWCIYVKTDLLEEICFVRALSSSGVDPFVVDRERLPCHFQGPVPWLYLWYKRLLWGRPGWNRLHPLDCSHDFAHCRLQVPGSMTHKFCGHQNNIHDLNHWSGMVSWWALVGTVEF